MAKTGIGRSFEWLRGHKMRIVARPDSDGIVWAPFLYEALDINKRIVWFASHVPGASSFYVSKTGVYLPAITETLLRNEN